MKESSFNWNFTRRKQQFALLQEIILLIGYYFLLIHPALQASHNRPFRGMVKILVRNSEKYSRLSAI